MGESIDGLGFIVSFYQIMNILRIFFSLQMNFDLFVAVILFQICKSNSTPRKKQSLIAIRMDGNGTLMAKNDQPSNAIRIMESTSHGTDALAYQPNKYFMSVKFQMLMENLNKSYNL